MLQRPATLTEHAISTIRSIRSGGGVKKIYLRTTYLSLLALNFSPSLHFRTLPFFQV